MQKEFFQLIAPEVFSKRVGFEWDDETNRCWFAKGKQPWAEYELAGVIVGLAVYNGHALDLRLPKAAYKKLTREQRETPHEKPLTGRSRGQQRFLMRSV